MSIEKKKYIAPKYEMVKFDTQIMTGWQSGCWGVVGNTFSGDGECHTVYYNGENVFPINSEYYD